MGKKRNVERDAVLLAVGKLRAMRNAHAVLGLEEPPEWLLKELRGLESDFRAALGMEAEND